MRYWEITQKEKQEYSLEDLTAELNRCILDVLKMDIYSATQKADGKVDR